MYMFTYVILCRDAEEERRIGPYLSDDELLLFETKEEAFNAALDAANEELETLNDDDMEIPEDADEMDENCHTFGIAEDEAFEKGDAVKIECYWHANDDTELVTLRKVTEINPRLSQEQKDKIIDMVKEDFETGQIEGDRYSVISNMLDDVIGHDGFFALADEAANYYLELTEMGPAGFYEEFPELDWSQEYIDEYGS